MLTRGVWQCGECGETFTSNKQFRLHTTCHKRCNDPLQHAPNREQNVSNTNQLGTDDELAAYDEGSQTDDQPLEPPQQFDATQFGTQQSAEESRAKRLRINDAVFIKLCADNKFTQAQTNSILGARANGIELSEVTFKSANDMQDYQINLLPAAERWSSTSIQVKSHVVEFWHRDPVSCIQKLYSDTKHGDGFFYEGDRDAKSEPHGTSVWLDEEDAVRRRLGSDSFIAGVQLYADATVVTLKGRSVHPVYLCLLNHPYSKKILSIDSLAYLPQLEFVESIDPDEDRILKLKLYHKAFRILFTSLRSMKDGVLMTGVDKRRRLVVGILLDFIGDNPEICDLTAVFKCFNAMKKCQRCLTPTSCMGELPGTQTIRMRTESGQRDVTRKIMAARSAGNAGDAQSLITRYSTHPVENAFYDLGVVDIHQKITYEKMHDSHLGVTRLVLRIIESRLKQIKAPRQLKEIKLQLNTRLSNLDRYYDLELPLYLKKGYFFYASHVTW